MEREKLSISETLGQERRSAAGAWLVTQFETLDQEPGEIRQRLKDSGITLKSDHAVRNWLRGDNGVARPHLLHLIAVLWDQLKENVRSDEQHVERWCRECLDWLALYDVRAAELVCDTDSRDMRMVLGKLQAAEQAHRRWGFRAGALSKTLATREMMEGVVEALLSVASYRQPRHRAVILYGGSGHGQTTLARQLEADERIWNWYRGGIVWLNLRGTRDEAETQSRLLKLLEIAPGPEALSTLHRQLSDPARRYLLILEDVDDWNSLSTVLRWLGGQAQVVVTTSAMTVAREHLTAIWDTQAVLYRQVPSFTEGEARQLAALAQMSVSPGAEANAFVECWQRVGGHPEMLKALLWQAERRTWAEICAVLRQPGVDLAFAGVSPERLTLIQAMVARLTPPSRDYVQQLYETLWAAETFEPLAAEQVWKIPTPAAQVMLEVFEAAGLIESRPTGNVYRLLPMVKAALLPKEKVLAVGGAAAGPSTPAETPSSPTGGAARKELVERTRGREQWLNRLSPAQIRVYLALHGGLSPAAQMGWDQCWELPWVKAYTPAELAALWKHSEPAARRILLELARCALVEVSRNENDQVVGCRFFRETLYFAEYQAALRGDYLTDAEKLRRPWIERYATSAAGRSALLKVWCQMQKVGVNEWWAMMRTGWRNRTLPFRQALRQSLDPRRAQTVLLAEMPELTLTEWVMAVRQRQKNQRVNRLIALWGVIAPTVIGLGQVSFIRQNVWVMLGLLVILLCLTPLGLVATGASYQVLFDWHRLAVVVDPVNVLVYQE